MLYVDQSNSSNFFKAIECFDNALQLEPSPFLSSEALYYKGLAWIFIGNYSNAIYCFDDAIEFKGDNLWAAWFSKGVAFENLGDHESADLAFKEATERSKGRRLISFLGIKSNLEMFSIYLKSFLEYTHAPFI